MSKLESMRELMNMEETLDELTRELGGDAIAMKLAKKQLVDSMQFWGEWIAQYVMPSEDKNPYVQVVMGGMIGQLVAICETLGEPKVLNGLIETLKKLQGIKI